MKLFNSKTIFLFFLWFHYLFNAFSCAAIQSPSGGPKDDTPPILLYSSPETGTTNFDQSTVQLFFSEYILERSISAVSYTHLRAHETRHDLVCRLLLEKKK